MIRAKSKDLGKQAREEDKCIKAKMLMTTTESTLLSIWLE